MSHLVRKFNCNLCGLNHVLVNPNNNLDIIIPSIGKNPLTEQAKKTPRCIICNSNSHLLERCEWRPKLQPLPSLTSNKNKE